MLKIINERNIEITRGDMLPLTIINENPIDNSIYPFQVGDVVRFKVFKKKDVEEVLFVKDFEVKEETEEFDIFMTSEEMEIGPIINKDTDYWYEIELNPETDRRTTIMGYEKKLGPALITLLPEGGDKK